MNEREVYENWKRRNEQDCSQDEAYAALKAYADGLEEHLEAVKKTMVEAIAILDNDLFVSKNKKGEPRNCYYRKIDFDTQDLLIGSGLELDPYLGEEKPGLLEVFDDLFRERFGLGRVDLLSGGVGEGVLRNLHRDERLS